MTLTDLQSRMSRAQNGGYHGFWTRHITVVTWNTAANYHPLGFVLASLSKRRTQQAQNNVTSGLPPNNEGDMGRGILLWRLGVPIPTIVFLLLLG